MAKFLVEPHFRLQECVAEEKGYFAAEGLITFGELIRSSAGQHHLKGDKVGAFQSIEQGREADVSYACHWTVNVAASKRRAKLYADAYSVAHSGIFVGPWRTGRAIVCDQSRRRCKAPSASVTRPGQQIGSSNRLPWCEPPGHSARIAASWMAYAPAVIIRCPHMHQSRKEPFNIEFDVVKLPEELIRTGARCMASMPSLGVLTQ